MIFQVKAIPDIVQQIYFIGTKSAQIVRQRTAKKYRFSNGSPTKAEIGRSTTSLLKGSAW
jgi:hypothetical protein